MNTYKLIQTVALTTEMTRGEYNQMRGWTLPANENADDPGYLVQEIGQPENVEGYKGYCSWQPKEKLESISMDVELPYWIFNIGNGVLDRLAIDYAELHARMTKLERFLNSTETLLVPLDQLTLMKVQQSTMQALYDILRMRTSMILEAINKQNTTSTL